MVDDLKAAAALLSSVVVEAGCQRLQAIVIDVPCMHHAPSDWRSARQSDSHESFDHTCWIAVKRFSTSASISPIAVEGIHAQNVCSHRERRATKTPKEATYATSKTIISHGTAGYAHAHA